MTNNTDKKNLNYSFFQENIAFFVCLLFAIVVWTGMKMSEQLQVSQTYDINYKIDGAYDFVSPPPAKIDFVKSGSGWDLIASRTAPLDRHITIETVPELKQQFVQRGELIQIIAAKINSPDIKIDQLSVDVILLDYEVRKVKRIPIRLVGDVSPSSGYIFTSPAKLLPDSVTISGAKSILDTILTWPTLPLGNILIKENYERIIYLQHIENINLDIETTTLSCAAEQMTERRMVIPIYTDQKNIRLVPATVEVQFNTSISQFNSIRPEQFSFKARIDTTNYQLNKNAPVILEKYPGHIINVRYQPKVVEYLFN